MKRVALFALAGLMTWTATHAVAQVQELMMHNDSIMRAVYGNISSINIYYEAPREGIRATGVRQGTLLFNGQIASYGTPEDAIWGTARIFKAGCSPATYYVEGTIILYNGTIVLRGEAPVFAPGNSCAITRYEYNSNSTLIFEPYGPPPH